MSSKRCLHVFLVVVALGLLFTVLLTAAPPAALGAAGEGRSGSATAIEDDDASRTAAFELGAGSDPASCSGVAGSCPRRSK